MASSLSHSQKSQLLNASKIFLRNFGLVYGAKGVASILFGALVLRQYKNPKKLVVNAFGSDTIRFALFLGTLTGSYKIIYSTLLRLRGKEDAWNSVLAGGISGLSLLFDNQKKRRQEVTLYVFARAVVFMYSHLTRLGYIPYFKYGDTLLFCVVAAFIQYAFVYEPFAMNKKLYDFIYRFLPKSDRPALDYTRHLAEKELTDKT